MRYRNVGTVGGKGSGPGEFRESLRGLWVDGRDALFMAGDSEVKIFDRSGHLRGRWATAKPAATIAVAADETVWVGEEGQIEVFARGRLVRTWRDEGWRGEITSIGFLGDSVLVGDAKDRSIKRYDRAGALVNTIGKDNHVRGFLIPNGAIDFSVDAAGLIHAANPGRHCVERYSADGRLEERVGHFDGVKPDGYGGCCNPTNVVVAKGRTYVTEKAAPRAKVLDLAGKLLAVIATTELDPLCRNSDIAVDSFGRVYVADTVRLQALVFEEAS